MNSVLMEGVIGVQKQVEKWEEQLEALYKRRDDMVAKLGKLDVEGDGEGKGSGA